MIKYEKVSRFIRNLKYTVLTCKEKYLKKFYEMAY